MRSTILLVGYVVRDLWKLEPSQREMLTRFGFRPPEADVGESRMYVSADRSPSKTRLESSLMLQAAT